VQIVEQRFQHFAAVLAAPAQIPRQPPEEPLAQQRRGSARRDRRGVQIGEMREREDDEASTRTRANLTHAESL
jgi:hypothetical protein